MHHKAQLLEHRVYGRQDGRLIIDQEYQTFPLELHRIAAMLPNRDSVRCRRQIHHEIRAMPEERANCDAASVLLRNSLRHCEEQRNGGMFKT